MVMMVMIHSLFIHSCRAGRGDDDTDDHINGLLLILPLILLLLPPYHYTSPLTYLSTPF
jgi:hypothetical protein